MRRLRIVGLIIFLVTGFFIMRVIMGIYISIAMPILEETGDIALAIGSGVGVAMPTAVTLVYFLEMVLSFGLVSLLGDGNENEI